jgi:serine/threonine-protein kinase
MVGSMDAPREVGVGEARYRLGELLGSGATGAVYAGTAPDGQHVAVKLLHDYLTEIPEMVARFRREADLASKIESDHVAPVLAAGRTEEKVYWIAYKRLFGETLDVSLRRERVFRADRARAVIEHVLLGLQPAHVAGVVHRDIKPANVFLERHGDGTRACILDFGASKYRPPSGAMTSQHLTTARETLGTINYMPPEQFSGAARVDARADLYAVGVVGFKLLTGTLPFLAGSRGAVMQAKTKGRPLSLREVTDAAWPEKLEGFFRCALARAPEERFASAGAMLNAWRDAVAAADGSSVDVLRRRLAGSQDTDDTVIEPSPEGTL